MEQINPLDMTGILQCDVNVLRTGLLNIRGILAPMVEFPDNVKEGHLRDAIAKAIEEVDKTLVKEGEVKEKLSVNS